MTARFLEEETLGGILSQCLEKDSSNLTSKVSYCLLVLDLSVSLPLSLSILMLLICLEEETLGGILSQCL